MQAADVRPILILNTGSSTFKWALLGDDERFLGTGTEEWEADDALTRKTQIEAKLHALPPCRAVGHRIVHGGLMFEDSVIIDEAVRREFENLLTLDMLHMRPAMCALDAARDAFPDALQVAAFDTAFHRTMSKAAAGYALPTEWTQRWGLRRFGFHGLSVSWSVDWMRRNAEAFPRRMIVAHLGSGCSVTAVLDGRSVDTSMGFTPLEGLMMGTRAGSVDPGLLLHLLTQRGVTVLELEDALTNRSGLLGVSGVSSDMREVLKAADQGNSNAWLAYDRFIFCARRAVGAAAGVLGGVDAIVFTGGIGEHQPRVRHDISAAFEGLQIDDAANSGAAEGRISTAESRVSATIVRAREELVLLREVRRFVSAGG
ncbi:MAG: acetate/propionate family kinase [Gammaproteobacteria bacterium]